MGSLPGAAASEFAALASLSLAAASEPELETSPAVLAFTVPTPK